MDGSKKMFQNFVGQFYIRLEATFTFFSIFYKQTSLLMDGARTVSLKMSTSQRTHKHRTKLN